MEQIQFQWRKRLKRNGTLQKCYFHSFTPIFAALLTLSLLNAKSSHADDQSLPKNNITENNINDIIGEYQGEVRLQSSDGHVNRSLMPHAHLNVSISHDELKLDMISDLSGKNCHSQIGGIREVLTYPPGDSQILEAKFDFNTKNHCATFSKFDTLLVYFERDQAGTLTLETLLFRGSIDLALKNILPQKLNIHGYFTKVDNWSTSPN